MTGRQMERALRRIILSAARAGGITRVKLRIRVERDQREEIRGGKKDET